jgi:hypothetical protein
LTAIIKPVVNMEASKIPHHSGKGMPNRTYICPQHIPSVVRAIMPIRMTGEGSP